MTGDTGAAAPAAALLVEGLSAGYGETTVIDGVDLRASRERVTVVIGPNGAGKSTLIKAVYGVVPPRRGRVLLAMAGSAVDVTRRAPHEHTWLGMGYVPQTSNVFANMSVVENLELGAGRPRRRLRAELERVLAVFPGIAGKLNRRAGALSGGERQMVALARAMIRGPQVLLLDEPTAGLAAAAVDELFDRLTAIAGLGTTVVMVEQNARRALTLADYAYVLDAGRNRFEGTGRELYEDPKVAELYLGGARAGGAVTSQRARSPGGS